ncbi:glycosyltransferase family 4 protein [Pilimelia anulata]|nr:glycosyltransferase family 4 protein [Pilimelia anulata]
MLVDNAVDGDSRVQKAARAAADAGWHVTVLGCAPGPTARTRRLGAARLLLLPLSGGDDRGAPGGAGWRARLLARGGLPLRLARLAKRPVDRARVWYWRAAAGDRAWRRLEPGLWHYERAFGPVVDDLAPDLIHAHDVRMLGVGARAAARARAVGRPVRLLWDAHEYLPGVKPGRNNACWLPAHRGYAREYAGRADAVVTVSAPIADLMRREYRLATRPTVVLNAPDLAAGPAAAPPDLRRQCGIGPATPLLVYSGAALPQRGLDTAVAALPRLPGVHLALVVGDPAAPYVRAVLGRAARRGVADRVHALPYVPHDAVVPYLAAADVGLIPLHHWPNHELALITKFFEYAHARLPIVVSDVRTMAATVRRTGQGEVFRARSAAGLARAVRAVLADPARYRAAYDRPDCLLPEWTWAAQAATLTTLYRTLAPPSSAPPPPAAIVPPGSAAPPSSAATPSAGGRAAGAGAVGSA